MRALKLALFLIVINSIISLELGIKLKKTSQNLSETSSNYLVKLAIGNRKLIFKIDNQNPLTKLFSKKGIDESLINEVQLNDSLDKIQVEDKLSIQGISMDNFKFEVENKSNEFGYDGTLALNFKKNSFISQLHDNGLIYKKVFTQRIIDNNIGVIQIGEISDKIIKSEDYSTCKNVKNEEFTCLFSGILTNGIKNNLRGVANFDLSQEFIVFPKNQVNLFARKIFKNYLRSKTCEISNEVVTCNQKIEIDSIKFIFDNIVYEIKSQDLFQEIDGKYVFIIKFSNEKGFYTFGQFFNRQFFLLFNGETNEIGFLKGDKTSLSLNTHSEISNTIKEKPEFDDHEADIAVVFLILGFLLTALAGIMIYLCIVVRSDDERDSLNKTEITYEDEIRARRYLDENYFMSNCF